MGTPVRPMCERPFCTRLSVKNIDPDDPKLCGPHRQGAAVRKLNQDRRARQSESHEASYRRGEAMISFALAWREKNRDSVYTENRSPCPLCGLVVQQKVTEVQPRFGFFYTSEEAIKAHQESHGQDWLDFQNAGGEGAVVTQYP